MAGPKIQLESRVDTAANWTATNPTLKAGETPWILLDIYRQGGMVGWIKSRRSEYETLEQG